MVCEDRCGVSMVCAYRVWSVMCDDKSVVLCLLLVCQWRHCIEPATPPWKV